MHSKSYVFFFPSREVGGIPVLFLRMAEHLAQSLGKSVYIIDYPDGYMAQNKKNPLISLLPYHSSKEILVPNNSTLVFQSDLPWGLPLNLVCDDSTTAFFWNCFPFNLIPVLPAKGRIWMSQTLCRTKFMLNTFLLPAKLKVQKFRKILEDRNALIFMDGANLRFTEKALGKTLKTHDFLPIPLPSTTKTISSTQTNTPLNFYWIGRIADFKVSSLIFALQKTASWASESSNNVVFNIIGTGDRMLHLEKAIKNINGIKINFLGNMSLDTIENRLVKDADLLFGMGTAALEGAKLGVPTLLVDFSYDTLPSDYKCQWIYNTTHFTLGEQIDTLPFEDRPEIECLFNQLLLEKQKISESCLTYFKQNHLLESIAPKFVQLSLKSTFQYSKFLKSNLWKKPFYYVFWNLLKKSISSRES